MKHSQNLVHFLHNRECGFRLNFPKSLNLHKIAEEKAASSEMEEIHCKLPSSVRSTFLMSFSPDCSKVASTHGDHKIYICDVKSGKLLHKLEGHPRTPWCVVFHPTSNDILASGCLGGEVRVWDLHGGSEQWRAEQNTVITSLTFHPLDNVLVIATFNRIHFWNWNYSTPFATCSTSSVREKVRFVKFNRLGTKLITGVLNQPEVISENSNEDRVQRSVQEPSTEPSSRRSIWFRLLNIVQTIDGVDEDALERARNHAEILTLIQRHNSNSGIPPTNTSAPTVSQNTGNSNNSSASNSSNSSASNSSGGATSSSSIPSSSNSNNSELRDISESHEEFLVRAFWRTFNRLRTICSALERRMHQLQRSSEPQNADNSTSPPSSSASELPNDESTQNEASGGRSGTGNATSEQLVNILTRLQNSLQFSAIAESVPPEQIQQLQWRISEILERLTNVTGYRARLTTLRDHIFEVAERSEHRMEGSSPISRQDLGHCLFLVEMSLQLTRQMQRILQADYRLIRLSLAHPSNSSQPLATSSRELDSPPSAPRSNVTSLSSLCVLCGNRGFTSRANDASSFEPSTEFMRREREFREIQRRLLQQSITQRQTLPETMANLRAELLHPHPSVSSTSASSGRHPMAFPRPLVGLTPSSRYASSSESSDSSGDENPALNHVVRLRRSSSANFQPPRPTAQNLTFLSGSSSSYSSTDNEVMQATINASNENIFSTHHRAFSNFQRTRIVSQNLNSFTPSSSSNSSTDNEVRQPSQASNENEFSSSHRAFYVPNVQDEPLASNDSQTTTRANNEVRNSFRRINFNVPNVQIDVSPSTDNQDPVVPPQERPRSPPLSTIMSGNSDFSIWQYEPFLSNWHPYISQAFYEASRRSQFGGSHDNNNSNIHRIQCWNFSNYEIPDIMNAKANVVVSKCKIHNDASVSISQDGEILATLVPSTITDSVTFAIYSLKPEMLGVCLYKSPYDGNAISVSLSPFNHYVVVGISPPLVNMSNMEKEAVAHIYKLKIINEKVWSGYNVRSLSQQTSLGNQVSLNSVQWLPQSGQGLIYGTNKGCLCICKPIAPMPANKSKLKFFKLFNPDSDSFSTLSRQRRNSFPSSQSMSSASTQTIEPTTQTTGTQTFVTNGTHLLP